MDRGLSIADLTVGDMIRCGDDLQRAAERASGFGPAAEAMVDCLAERFTDKADTREFALVRLCVTRSLAQLPVALGAHVRAEHPTAPDDLACFALIASHCDELPEHDPSRSPHQRVVPLFGREVARRPVIADVLGDLRIDLDGLNTGVRHEASPADYGMFHLADAAATTRVPQPEFVRRHGIHSVLAVGGALPAGDAFSLMLFSRVPIPAVTAELFRPIALHARLGLLRHSPYSLTRGAGADLYERASLRELLALREQAVQTVTGPGRVWGPVGTDVVVRPDGTHTARFPPVPRAAGEARGFLARTLESWGVAGRGALRIVVGELAANAIRHTGAGFEVRLVRGDPAIRVEVTDEDARIPRILRAGPFDPGHRGLALVAHFADRWGVRPIPGGKTVWAEFDQR